MPPSKPSDKSAVTPSEPRYTIDLPNDIEYQGKTYEKGSHVEVPKGLAILQGAIEPDPTPEATVLAPEDVQSQVQTHLSDLVTRLADSERNSGILQTQLTSALADRDTFAAQVTQARQERDAAQSEADRLQAENTQIGARVAVLEAQSAAAVKSETGLISDPNKAAQ